MVSGSAETEIRNNPENGEWLSRVEYMERTGAQERTLTNWIKDGTVKSRMVEVEENGKLKSRRQVFFPYKKVAPEKNPESFQQVAGNDAGSQVVDPEVNFRQSPRFSIVDPEVSRIPHCLNCERLQGQIDLLKEQLREVEKAHARLEGEIKGKDELLAERQKLVDEKQETIQAKEQAINAANGMVLLYEKQGNPALEAKSGAVPEMTPEPSRQLPEKAAGWWDKLLGRA